MKLTRHALILQLIEQENVETQEELVSFLQAYGYDVTQATVSRDVKELHLIKVQTNDGHYKYATVDKAESGMTERFVRIFAQSVLSIRTAGNIIVIRTISGSANVAAEAIDSLSLPEIVGTIAGDNTIFCAVADGADTSQVANQFHILSITK